MMKFYLETQHILSYLVGNENMIINLFVMDSLIITFSLTFSTSNFSIIGVYLSLKTLFLIELA